MVCLTHIFKHEGSLSRNLTQTMLSGEHMAVTMVQTYYSPCC